ncbi:hypothetical protein LPJ75_005494 [Coemansia sp. RSA 2598]|nr:hypothetical protein LPJ75_005494 [Coemansia sp. RSA 2598]
MRLGAGMTISGTPTRSSNGCRNCTVSSRDPEAAVELSVSALAGMGVEMGSGGEMWGLCLLSERLLEPRPCLWRSEPCLWSDRSFALAFGLAFDLESSLPAFPRSNNALMSHGRSMPRKKELGRIGPSDIFSLTDLRCHTSEVSQRSTWMRRRAGRSERLRSRSSAAAGLLSQGSATWSMPDIRRAAGGACLGSLQAAKKVAGLELLLPARAELILAGRLGWLAPSGEELRRHLLLDKRRLPRETAGSSGASAGGSRDI